MPRRLSSKTTAGHLPVQTPSNFIHFAVMFLLELYCTPSGFTSFFLLIDKGCAMMIYDAFLDRCLAQQWKDLQWGCLVFLKAHDPEGCLLGFNPISQEPHYSAPPMSGPPLEWCRNELFLNPRCTVTAGRTFFETTYINRA